jgi:hypothetical protein
MDSELTVSVAEALVAEFADTPKLLTHEIADTPKLLTQAHSR